MENGTQRKKLLLIDDDADDRNYFVAAVKEIDPSLVCLTAANGDQALEYLKKTVEDPPKFIFLDLRMPRYSGKQILIKIKSDDKFQHIPVIIYTTSRAVQECEDLMDLGATHFISKPADPDEIYYVLTLVLEERWDEMAGLKNQL